MRRLSFVVLLLIFIPLAIFAQTASVYRTPPKEIADIVGAPPTPMASVSSRARWPRLLFRQATALVFHAAAAGARRVLIDGGLSSEAGTKDLRQPAKENFRETIHALGHGAILHRRSQLEARDRFASRPCAHSSGCPRCRIPTRRASTKVRAVHFTELQQGVK
jgi:hypothetical protein